MSNFVEKGKPTRLVVAEKGNNTHTTYGIAVADPDYQIRWGVGGGGGGFPAGLILV